MQNSTTRTNSSWKLRTRTLELGPRTLVMGVVNITPDSFSDGGLFLDSEAAVAHGLRLLDEGADLLDLGAESTRPGTMVGTPVSGTDQPRHRPQSAQKPSRRGCFPYSKAFSRPAPTR